MQVKDLIEKLREYDPERPIIIDHDRDGWYAIDSVRQIIDEEIGPAVSIDIERWRAI